MYNDQSLVIENLLFSLLPPKKAARWMLKMEHGFSGAASTTQVETPQLPPHAVDYKEKKDKIYDDYKLKE